jgi:predicted metal-binding protein
MHTLFVCTTCTYSRTDQEFAGKRGGQHLLEDLLSEQANWDLTPFLQIQPVECMSACTRSCAISLAATGKYTYLFGDLPALESAAAILECADLYVNSDNGYLPWANRPQLLKNGILARIPPLPAAQ